MPVADSKVDAESVPGLAVAVAEVMFESIPEVTREANVVELLPAIEGVDVLSAFDVLPDDVLVFLKGFSGNLFETLSYKRVVLRHSAHWPSKVRQVVRR